MGKVHLNVQPLAYKLTLGKPLVVVKSDRLPAQQVESELLDDLLRAASAGAARELPDSGFEVIRTLWATAHLTSLPLATHSSYPRNLRLTALPLALLASLV